MSARYVVLFVIGLILLGVMGGWGESEDAQTPRYREPPQRIEPPPQRPDLQPRRPLPEAPEVRPDGSRSLAPPSRTDPEFDVPIPDERRSSVGTAFSVDGRGAWMTARHVADGCSRMIIFTGPREGFRVASVYIHPSADIAVIRAERGAPPVAFSDVPPRVGQAGYHFGYPKGEPGAAYSTLLGRATMRARGRYNTTEPVLVWAERERVPDGDEHLGGISGGPTFDTNGRVIGVTVAGSIRRARVFTADMSSVRAALARANATVAPEGSVETPRLSPSNWITEAAALRRKLTFAKVACLVDEGQTWRPRAF